MFFNQPVIMEQNRIGIMSQLDSRLSNLDFSYSNAINSPPLSFIQSTVTTKLPQQLEKTGWDTATEIIEGLALGILIGGALVLVGAVVFELIRPRRNSVPLTARVRRYIRERDGEICFYCGDHAPDGHVDHRISRANNGGNDLANLTWACVFCNCSKGAMNDTEYIALIETYC